MANNDGYDGKNERSEVQQVEVRRVPGTGPEAKAEERRTPYVGVYDACVVVTPGGFAGFTYSPRQETMTSEMARAVLQRVSSQGMLIADPALISEAVRVLEERV